MKKGKKTKKSAAAKVPQKGKPDKKELVVRKNPFPLPPQPKNFRQIEYNEKNGRLKLVDYHNNIFECNMFGEEIPSFRPYISGISSFKNRIEKKCISPLTLTPTNFDYHPVPKKFEGYFPFPRPLSLPFINDFKDPSQLINEISKENRINTEKNKRLIQLKIPTKDYTCRLGYITTTLTGDDVSTKKYIIKLIDDFIDSEYKEHVYNSSVVDEDPRIHALRRLKRIILINMDSDTVFGKKLEKPKAEIKERFNIIHSILTKPKKHRIEGSNDEIYRTMYKIKTVQMLQSRDKARSEKDLSHFTSPSREKKVTSPGNTIYGATLSNLSSNYNNTISTGFGEFRTSRAFEEKNKKDLSFLDDKEKDEEEVKELTRTYTNIKKDFEKEEKLLGGFVPEVRKEGGIILKIRKKIKTPGDNYVKDIDLLKKVNPIAFKVEEDKEKFLLRQIAKKKKDRLIYERIKIKK